MEQVLQVKNLTTCLRLGKNDFPVVNGISFNLHQGRTLALVGESGCGKSMTALSIMRILPSPPALPSTGEVIYCDKNLLKISEGEMRDIRGNNIGMIFQDPMSSLNPVYSIGDQLLEVAEAHLGLYGDEAEQKVMDALEDVRIPDPKVRFHDYPHQLSGGMKQRVMIAMSLMCEPDVLIADEPTTALDVTIQAQVLNLMKDLQQKKGMAILLITHDMGVVADMADDVVVMYATKEIEKGSKRQIFQHKAHPYTEGLFNSLPQVHQPKEKLNVISGSVPSIKKLPTGCHFHPRCPYVMEVCRQGEVPDFPIGEEYSTKCWLYKEKTCE
ncbi:MAG: Oligopeptide transport ATP-binding protein OppD [Chlamydiae bacterium]|nr:Oligopeptide transport ATP-binding protein OppD [Chlamydiota bacterium]